MLFFSINLNVFVPIIQLRDSFVTFFQQFAYSGNSVHGFICTWPLVSLDQIGVFRLYILAPSVASIKCNVFCFFSFCCIHFLINTLYCVSLCPPLPQFGFEEDLTENHLSYKCIICLCSLSGFLSNPLQGEIAKGVGKD